MGLIERFVDEQEEKLARVDEALKDSGRFRLGAFEGPESDQFGTVEGMIAAVDEKLKSPLDFFGAESDLRSFRLRQNVLEFEICGDGRQRQQYGARHPPSVRAHAPACSHYRSALERSRRVLRGDGRGAVLARLFRLRTHLAASPCTQRLAGARGCQRFSQCRSRCVHPLDQAIGLRCALACDMASCRVFC